MRTISTILLAVAVSLASISHAAAAATGWQDLGGGKARLLASAQPGSEKVELVLEVQLQPGWKTYWREPSGSGIPPTFDFSASSGFAFDEPRFPVPEYLDSGGSRFAGYKGIIRFLIEGNRTGSGNDGVIALQLLIGVCEEICIPADAHFNLAATDLEQSDFRAMQAIDAARQTLPGQDSESLKIVSVSQAGENTLRVEAKAPASAQTVELFAEAPRGWYVAPAELLSFTGGNAVFELPAERGSSAADGSARFRFTLKSGDGAIEQWHSLDAQAQN